MNQSSHLYHLQNIDSQLNKIIQRINEINQILASNAAVQADELTQKNAQDACQQARSKLRLAEDSVNSTQIKIQTNEAALYSGRHSPKELQDLQSENNALKRRFSALEEEQLEAMLGFEEVEKALQLASEQLNKTLAEVASQQSSLVGERSQLQKQQEQLQTEKDALCGSILPENLSVYQRLLKRKRGIAVTKVEDFSCASCGSSITPSDAQLARSPKEMVYCKTCGRILYAG